MIKKNSFKSILLNIILFLSMICLVGCNKYLSQVPLERVDIVARDDANNNFATAIELVVVFDKHLAGIIGAMSAKEYFQKSSQLKLDNCDNILTWRWEVVPGQVIYKTDIKYERHHPVAGFLFARYYSDAPHRVKLAKQFAVKVVLNSDTFVIENIKTD